MAVSITDDINRLLNGHAVKAAAPTVPVAVPVGAGEATRVILPPHLCPILGSFGEGKIDLRIVIRPIGTCKGPIIIVQSNKICRDRNRAHIASLHKIHPVRESAQVRKMLNHIRRIAAPINWI